MSYDFSALNDRDFEELIRDMVSIQLNHNFQSFKRGPDRGIDLRYSTSSTENEIVVQVKHFINTSFSKLKRVLDKEEKEKVKKINPKRYIFATSSLLTSNNKEIIKSIFSPYIGSTSDIIDRQDIIHFLKENSTILERNFKLWLSDTNVLKRIIHNGVSGRSEFHTEKILDRIKIFVPCESHSKAVKILNENNFILITGDPGIGKTTLAEILTLQLLAENYELVVVREIKEAEDLYTPRKKQVFYFDDFLGSSTLDLKSSRNADSAIASFTERIRSDRQKRLILTCRTTLLNRGKIESDALENSKIEISRFEIVVENYRAIDKARILYNHIYLSNLTEEKKSVFFEAGFYWKILKHKNYNPRIIEFFTNSERIRQEVDYQMEILHFLDNPSRIWEKSFIYQISKESRILLTTLYSLGEEYYVSETRLRHAFDSRIEYEIKNNNYTIVPDPFNSAVKELLGGYVNRIVKTENNSHSVEFRFLNASISDFLYFYFSENIPEYFNILKCAFEVSQFTTRISTKTDPGAKKINLGDEFNYAKLLNTFNDRVTFFTKKKPKISTNVEIVSTLINLFKWPDIRTQVVSNLNSLTISEITWQQRDQLIKILNYIKTRGIMNEFDFSIDDMIVQLSNDITHLFEIEAYSHFIQSNPAYQQLIKDWKTSSPERYQKIQSNVDNFWSNHFEAYILKANNLNGVNKRAELLSLVKARREEAKKINLSISVKPSPVIDQYQFDLDIQIERNKINTQSPFDQIEPLLNEDTMINETTEIDRLFNCPEGGF